MSRRLRKEGKGLTKRHVSVEFWNREELERKVSQLNGSRHPRQNSQIPSRSASTLLEFRLIVAACESAMLRPKLLFKLEVCVHAAGRP